ncbi:MAG: two-component system nitrogen regulation sensor histidine kinase NtrY [Flavobacteriales bacterium]|jgi:two-component system nitrogen regulation sensor histidine kinase NtrY
MNRFKLTLRSRIYFSMLALLIISFAVTGVTAYQNYKSQDATYHESRFKRKETAVQESMEYFVNSRGGYIAQDSITMVFTDKICELADVHNMTISLFDLRGELLLSSTPSDTLDAPTSEPNIEYSIFKQLSTGYERAEVIRENDDHTFILAYWYFNDFSGQPIFITNVRYDKSEANTHELNEFLLELTYVYIVLFLGASLLAFFISNYITKSLQRIGQRMSNVRLGERNEPLEWESKDEIGALVEEYNHMLQEVEDNAAKLARSERESAWREMAKQVAHEIKNPLTPMKLRIQHLGRSWDDKAPNFEVKLKETIKSLIDQIDTLTNIANEFSNFAKMPKAQRIKLNLIDLAKGTVELFQNHDGVKVKFDDQTTNEVCVNADKDQLIRVLNNLIKNSIQAIPSDQEGQVRVRVKDYRGMALMEVEDNGTGIPKEQEEKIFVPNFTTKSTGTGLGLAMVKNIIEQAEGDIWFKTVVGRGTTFFVSLPLCERHLDDADGVSL